MESQQGTDRVLTQEELDALLSMVGSEAEKPAGTDLKPKKVVQYDFTRPEKFSREHLRFLQMVHENYARALSNDLSLLLRMRFEVTTKPPEPGSFERFLGGCADNDVAALVQMEDLQTFLLMTMEMPIAFAVADRLLGGSGSSKADKRELTGIDTMIITRVFQQFLTTYGSMWSASVREEHSFSMIRVQLGSETLEILPSTESVAIVTHEVITPNIQGELRWCLPYATLDPLLEKASFKQGFEAVERSPRPEIAMNVRGNVEQAEVMLRVVLGYGQLTVKDLKSLKVDDVLLLTQKVDEPIVMLVENTPLVRGYAGMRGRNLAFRVHDTQTDWGDEGSIG